MTLCLLMITKIKVKHAFKFMDENIEIKVRHAAMFMDL
jgi:hypothetical protein